MSKKGIWLGMSAGEFWGGLFLLLSIALLSTTALAILNPII